MMNVIEIQDKLKNFSQDQLINEMQMPSGNVPQYLVLSEINRRKRMQDSYQQEQNEQQADQTVAQEKLAAAGVPEEGIAGLASAIAPKTDIAQNTGVMPQQRMPMPEAPLPMAEAMPPAMMPPQGAGIRSMAEGGSVRRMQAGGSPVSTSRGLFYVSGDGLTVTDIQGNPAPEDVAREARAKKYDFGVRNAAERDAAFPVTSALGRNLGRFVRGAPDTGEDLGMMPPSLNDTSLSAPPPRSQEFFPSETPIANVMDSYPSSNMEYMAAGLDAIRASRREPFVPTGIMPPIDIDSTVRTAFPSNANTASIERALNVQRDARRGPPTGIMPPIDFDARSTDAFPSNRNTGSIVNQLDAMREAMRAPTDIGDTVMMSPSDARNINARRRQQASRQEVADLAASLDARRNMPRQDIGDFLAASEASRPPLSVDPVDLSKMMPPDYDPRFERTVGKYAGIDEAIAQKAIEDFGKPIPTKDIGDYLGKSPRDIRLARVKDKLQQQTEKVSQLADVLDARREQMGGKTPTKNEAAKSQEIQDQAKGIVNIDPFAGAESVLSPSAPSAPSDPDVSEVLKAVEAAGEPEYTSTESEIIQMLKDQKDRVERDKWMSLAALGLGILQNADKGLAGAVGAGGMAGLKQISKSREDYDDAKLALLGMRQKIDASRATRSTAKTKAARQYFDSLITNTLAAKKANDNMMAKYIDTDALSGATVNNAPEDLKIKAAMYENRLEELMAAKRKMLGITDYNAVQ